MIFTDVEYKIHLLSIKYGYTLHYRSLVMTRLPITEVKHYIIQSYKGLKYNGL